MELLSKEEVENIKAQEAISAVNPAPTPEKCCGKEIDWEERHFQICLALISRADLTSYNTNTVGTREIAPAKIIDRANRMVEALKQNLKEQESKKGN